MSPDIIEEMTRYPTKMTVEVMEALAEFSGIGLFNFHIPTGEITLNHNITKLTGYEPGDLPHTGNTKEMLTFEDDRARVNAVMGELIRGERESYQIEYRMRRRDSSIVSVREAAIVCEWDDEGKPERIAGMAQDLSALRWAEEKARRMERENKMLAVGLSKDTYAEHNRMLSACIKAAEMIIGGFHQDYETVLRQAFQILGESIQADRAYIWRNRVEDGKTTAFLRAIWTTESYPTHFSDNAILDYDSIFLGWQNSFKEGYAILKTKKDMPAPMAEFFEGQGIKGILLAPLYMHGEFFGLLGFDSCREERQYTDYEAQIMVAGTMIIASSIARNETFIKLNQAREEALASTKAKGEFLSRMSHEIRTPMNAIIGMTTIAKNADDAERMRYCLEKVDASSRQLLSLINDVLDMSKIESGKLEISKAPFDFEKMIENVINVVQVKLDEKHQTMDVDFNSVFNRLVISDELRLSQVLINLMNNAVKFTPEKGNIQLKIEETPLGENTSQLRVEVKDNGIGISSEQQQRLFQSFEQADGSITRNYGGTGLGLAISKKIVNLLGGDIWIESELGQGSSFIFTIETQWGEKFVPDAASQENLRKMRILVVDDAPDVLEYFKNILMNYELDCDTASCGREAIEAVQQSIAENRTYDMVFVDWNMPDMNGGITAKEIQKLCDKIIIVMISVADWADIETDAKAFGVNHFLSKPVLPSMLYNTIVKLSDHSFILNEEEAKQDDVDWSNRTILMAEDIAINREIIESLLSDTQVTLVHANDGKEAIDIFTENPDQFDLILMDMQMPEMDGVTATRKLRAMDLEQAKTVPIIAMTANAFKEDIEICEAAGMNAHLAKPLDVSLMMKTIGQYFQD